MTNAASDGGGADYHRQPTPLTQSPRTKSPEEEQNDRVRGEAVASAILLDKFASLHLASSSLPADEGMRASSTPGLAPTIKNSADVVSVASDAVAGILPIGPATAGHGPRTARRATITQPSSSTNGLPVAAPVMLASEIA